MKLKSFSLIALTAAIVSCATAADIPIHNLPQVLAGDVLPNDELIINHYVAGILKSRRILFSDLKTALAAEPFLGVPASNGRVLSSTTGGTRSWITIPTTGEPPLGNPLADGWVLTSLTNGNRSWGPPASLADVASGIRTNPTAQALIKQTDENNEEIPLFIPVNKMFDTGAQVINAKAYGASGSDKTTTLSSGHTGGGGSTTAVFITGGVDGMAFEPGHGISIAGAGPSGGLYVGKIVQALTGATSVIITPVTTTTVSSGAVVKHDDTVSIQTAITAATDAGGSDGRPPSHEVYIPPGTYRCTSTISLPARVKLRGGGRAFYNQTVGTLLLWGDTFTTGNAIHATAPYCAIENMTIRGPDAAYVGGYDGTHGIYSESYRMQLKDVTVQFWGYGIRHYGSPGLHIAVQVEYCHMGALTLQSVPQFTSISSAYGNSFGSDGSGVHICCNSSEVNFFDPLIDEGENGPTFAIDDSKDVSLNNMTIYTSRGAGSGGGYGVKLNAGTVRVHLNGLHVQQYDPATNDTVKNIYIRGTGHTLTNVTTLKPTGFSGDDIDDTTTDSIWTNVNGKYRLRLPTSSGSVNSGELYSNSGVVTVKP